MLPKNFTLEKIEKDVTEMLTRGLKEHYYYHCIEHTLDVVKESFRIANSLVVSSDELEKLIVAAWFHDVGFIISPNEHENRGCEIMREYFSPIEDLNWIEDICAAIMATKIPQTPTSLIGQILCDADLDYLGRSDFKEIGNKLFQELKFMGILQSEKEWMLLQQKFLKQHHFFTETNKRLRDKMKHSHLLEIEKWIEQL